MSTYGPNTPETLPPDGGQRRGGAKPILLVVGAAALLVAVVVFFVVNSRGGPVETGADKPADTSTAPSASATTQEQSASPSLSFDSEGFTNLSLETVPPTIGQFRASEYTTESGATGIVYDDGELVFGISVLAIQSEGATAADMTGGLTQVQKFADGKGACGLLAEASQCYVSSKNGYMLTFTSLEQIPMADMVAVAEGVAEWH